MILINSWNRWQQDTQIEPAVETPPTSIDVSEAGLEHTQGYTYEGYGMKPLQVVRAELAPELALHGEEEPLGVSPTSRLTIHPNPFVSSIRLTLQLDSGAQVDVSIYDALGRRLETVANGQRAPGLYDFVWRGATVAPGLYFAVVRTADTVRARSLIKIGRH
jgi:hypothetical protein